jgi:hypothetical protein
LCERKADVYLIGLDASGSKKYRSVCWIEREPQETSDARVRVRAALQSGDYSAAKKAFEDLDALIMRPREKYPSHVHDFDEKTYLVLKAA